jgi:hypothetical protein
MSAIYTTKNQYRGINAHLHSLWQHSGGWEGFHTVHIGDLYKTLNALLVPMGYEVGLEESLQIRRLSGGVRMARPDVVIYETPRISPVATPVLAGQIQNLSVAELLAEDELSEKPYRALVIRPLRTEGTAQPIVWIELLSPANKGDSEDARAYRAKRKDVLVNGMVFVEIDYLHESDPTFPTLPLYRPLADKTWLPTARPYHIVVVDPRLGFEKGQAQVASFAVDEPFPTMTIPLAQTDYLAFDFYVPYRKSFEESLYGRWVDYHQLPINFQRYSPSDQARILNRMLAVIPAQQAGINLENVPLPTHDLTLDDALNLWEQIK